MIQLKQTGDQINKEDWLEEFLNRKGAYCNGNESDDVSYNENNDQQLPEGFANSCYKIVSPFLLQKLRILLSASTIVETMANLVTSLVYTEYIWKTLFLRNRNRFYLKSRSYSQINSIWSNKWTLCQPRH